MENLFKNYQLPEKTKDRNKRDSLINDFVASINLERANTKYKPVTPRVVAILINQHPSLKNDPDCQKLYEFYRICKQAKSFSAYFYWCVSPKKIAGHFSK